MKCCYITTLLLVIVLLMACQTVTEPEPVAQAPTAAEVQANVDAYIAAVGAANAAALTDLFTDDAIVMPPNAPAVVGKEAIMAMNQSRIEAATQTLTAVMEETQAVGDWVFTRGAFTLTAIAKSTGEETQDTGKWLSISRRQPDGTVKIHRHIYNSDLPLPAPED